MKKLVVKTAVLLFAMILACGGATQVHAKVKVKNVVAKSVTGSNKIVYVAKGKKVRLATNVTVTPSSAKNQKVTYKSSKKAFASVSTNGVIKGKKIGNAKVTVQSKKNKKKKTTIKVRVVYPVKEVTINNKNVALNVDGSKNLAVKVTGTKKKNFCKTVQWTTSNKKVAIVSAKGTVKAIGAGTAIITAKAVDGTGKKASCIVKVAPRKTSIPSKTSMSNVTSIMGIAINPYCNISYTDVVLVSLNQPKALTESDFSVMTKSSSDAKYMNIGKIDSLITDNNKDYRITLNSSLSNGDYVQVTINALDGVKTKEQRFITTNGYQRITIKTNVGCYYTYNIADQITDDSTMKIDSGSLPAGLTYNAKDNEISGIPTEVTDNQKCNISVTDEKGHVEKCELNFIVGDATNIVAADKSYGDLKGHPTLANLYFSCYIDACGGSGSYTYEMVDDCNGVFSVSTYGFLNASPSTLQPGTYKPVIRVIDKENNSIRAETTWTIVATKGARVTVKLTSSNNQDTEIYFRNVVTGSYYELDSTTGEKEKTVALGTYDVFYYSKRSDGGKRCNYLAKNLSITQDTTLQYTISNSFSIVCNLMGPDGYPYVSDTSVLVYMFNSSGKCVGNDTCNYTAHFNGYETGNYHFYFYNKSSNKLIGKIDSLELNGNTNISVELENSNTV